MKKKIFFLHPHFTLPGGAGRFALETARILVERGWEVHVACIKANQEITGGFPGIVFHELGGPLSHTLSYWFFLPRLMRKLSGILSSINPDILFSQVFPANWWGFLLKKNNPELLHVWMCQEPSAFIHSQKWINALPYSIAGIGARVLNPLLKSIDCMLAGYVDYAFSNSQFSRKLAVTAYGYHDEQLGICYPGVDIERFTNVQSLERKKYSVIVCGRITKFKNVDKTIQAVEILKKDFPEILLAIVGDGEERSFLETLVAKLSLQDVVTFYGAVSDDEMVKLMQTHTVLVHAAEEEPFGLAPIEAMSCGLPVIAMQSGGPGETVLHKETGYLCDHATSFEIAEALRWVFQSGLTSSLGEHARKRADMFSWNNAVDVLEEKFVELLASRSH